MKSHQIPWNNLQASGKQPERRVKIQTLTIQGPLSLSLCACSASSPKLFLETRLEKYWMTSKINCIDTINPIQQVIVQLSVLQRTYNWPHRQVIGEEFALSSDYYHPIKKQYTHSRSLRQELSSDTLQSPSTGEYLQDANSNRRYISLQR